MRKNNIYFNRNSDGCVVYDYYRDRFFFSTEPSISNAKVIEAPEKHGWLTNRECKKKGRFVSWIISPTSRCQGRCEYCFADHYCVGDFPMVPRDFGRLARRAAGFGMLRCDLSGGEPFLRDDLEEIIASMLPYVGVVLTTSARDIPFNRLQSVSKLLPFIQISLDGHTQKMNDPRDTNTRRVIKTIQEAISLGMKIRVLTVANRHNMNQLLEFGNILAGWGVWEWKIMRVIPAGRAVGWEGLLDDKTSTKLASTLKSLPLPTQLIGFSHRSERLCVILEDNLHLYRDKDGIETDLGKIDFDYPFALLNNLPSIDSQIHLNYYLLHHSAGGCLTRRKDDA